MLAKIIGIILLFAFILLNFRVNKIGLLYQVSALINNICPTFHLRFAFIVVALFIFLTRIFKILLNKKKRTEALFLDECRNTV